MQRLSAIESISPAFARTNLLFFQPFRWGRSWKLAASSYLALLGSIFIPIPLLLLAVPWSRFGPLPPHPLTVIASITAVYTLVVFLLFYLGIRMEFVEFGLASTATRTVAPIWRQTRDRTWPWLWLKVVIGSVLTLLAIPLLRHAVGSFVVLLRSLPTPQPAGRPDPAAAEFFFSMLHQMFTFYAGALVFFLLIRLTATLLHDFVLPFYLLEPAPLRQALRLGWHLCRQDLAAVSGFVGLKYLLGILGFVAQYTASIVLMIPGIIVAFLFGLIGAFALHLMPDGPAAKLLTVVGIVLLYLLFIAYTFYCQMFTIGYLLMLLENYGLYFTGSRYSRLGDLMEPPSSLSVPPPPPY